MPERLRIGIVGCGGIATAHTSAYQKVADVEIVSVFDVRREGAEKAASSTGARIACSVDEMVEKDRLDAVSVCTPPRDASCSVSAVLAEGDCDLV